ncbi:restriction endonuclease [Roseibium sp.]|uniref:nSTAND3 domain-containing NTPase n=1 Tax=Roseibium sp. TaxID=1936156 RepID=UPI003B5260D8
MSRLENLSHIDFEELCRDIAKADTGKRFSAFGPGPDGGIDGRHSRGADATILQCKHYIGSTFTALKSSLKKEVLKVSDLKPKRYLFFTSQSLTQKKSNTLAEIASGILQQPEDIWGREDIEGALTRYPEIEKSHIKLWLSSTAVLERILNSGLEAFTQATKEEILDDLRVYVRNPSFEEATKRLEDQKILIVSGPPGVGKTTLAKMISYQYLEEGWKFYAITSLEEGFAKVDDGKPTVFFFDDFLGRIELDRQSLLQRDTALATFVNRIRRSKNSRFVLTTRAHIFEEARRLSDHVDDKKLQLAKYILDVGAYTRKIRSQILFNHLSASELKQEHFEALLVGDWLKKIVDHKNYNPRIIASVSSDSIDVMKPSDYPGYIYHALENPELVWSKPYRALDMKSQNLLVALFFGSEYGQEVDELSENFSKLHRIVCGHYGQPTKPGDFEDALKSLESGFVSISGQTVSFVNPSVRDFLKSYLIEKEFLELLPATARRADWAKHLWRHVCEVFKSHPEIQKKFASAFGSYSQMIDATPSMKKSMRYGYASYSADDLSLADRAEMLLQWWEACGEEQYIEKALSMLATSKLRLNSWRDGRDLPQLHWWVSNFVDDDVSQKQTLLEAIEARLTNVIEDGLPPDELVSVTESVQEYMSDTFLTPFTPAGHALGNAIEYEFSNTGEAISHLDTEDSLTEHLDYLDSLAKLTGRDPEEAKSVVFDRISEIEESDHEERSTGFSPSRRQGNEKFDDDDLISLFSNLLRT